MHTSIFYGFWDYWELRHKVTFDGVNRLIIINQGVTEIDVQRDIYSAWKEWVLQEQNSKFFQALTTVGGEPTIAGQFLDATYFLINGWRLKPYAGTYTLNIEGNIFEVDGSDIFVPAEIDPAFPNNININTNTSVIVRRVDSESGGGLLPDERTALLETHTKVFEIDGNLFTLSSQVSDIATLLTGVDGKVDGMEGQLFAINDTVLEIKTILEQPIYVELEQAEKDALYNIEDMVRDLWRVHGLDSANPMEVSKTKREAGDVVQTIQQIGDKVKLTRT